MMFEDDRIYQCHCFKSHGFMHTNTSQHFYIPSSSKIVIELVEVLPIAAPSPTDVIITLNRSFPSKAISSGFRDILTQTLLSPLGNVTLCMPATKSSGAV